MHDAHPHDDPGRNRHLCPAPIGALPVSRRLQDDRHEVRFLDLMHRTNPRRALARAIDEHRPELICFSIRNVDNQSMITQYHPLDDDAALTAPARERGNAPLLIGGTAVTTFPEQIRKKPCADFSFAGDDTDAVARFVA